MLTERLLSQILDFQTDCKLRMPDTIAKDLAPQVQNYANPLQTLVPNEANMKFSKLTLKFLTKTFGAATKFLRRQTKTV